jgi:hypothetical protein
MPTSLLIPKVPCSMFISVGLCARATGVAGAPGNYKKGTPGNNNVAKSVHIPYREFG